MAPLIDCVFLLLIFFLVATTLKKIDKELPLTLPDAKAAIEVQQPEDLTVISIDEDGALYIDGAPVSISLLQTDMRNKGRADPGIKIRLDIDRETPFQRAMEVLDVLKFEGLDNVGIQTRREEGEFY